MVILIAPPKLSATRRIAIVQEIYRSLESLRLASSTRSIRFRTISRQDELDSIQRGEALLIELSSSEADYYRRRLTISRQSQYYQGRIRQVGTWAKLNRINLNQSGRSLINISRMTIDELLHEHLIH